MPDTVEKVIEKTLATAGSTEMARILAKRFFEELRECATLIPKALQEDTRKATAMNLHKLIGACAYFGAQDLHEALKHAEDIVKQGECVQANHELNKIHQMLKEVMQFEKAVLDKLK